MHDIPFYLFSNTFFAFRHSLWAVQLETSFHGMAVNMTVFPFRPYWMDVKSPEENVNNVKESKITGRDYMILETLAQKLNFSINVLPYGEWDEVCCSSFVFHAAKAS